MITSPFRAEKRYSRLERSRDGLTSIPTKLRRAHEVIRREYLILPREMYGHATLAMSAGKMLKKATTPLGVVVDTRSRAAERMMTWEGKENEV